jgi:hypothetical protein
MSENPYSPPLADRGKPGPRRSSLTAVAAGLTADVVGTFLFGTLATLMFGWVLSGGAPEEMARALAASTGYQLFSVVSGLAFTALGGYVAARVANHRELYHGLLLGIVTLLTGEVLIVMLSAELPLWQRLAHDLLAIPVAIIGARWRKLEKAAPR